MISFIYNITIRPLEIFFETVYGLADDFLWNKGLSIIALSLAMNFLVLPLYRRADMIQAAAAEKEKKLSPWISHIRKNFSGDERFMMLQAYYKESDYSAVSQLGGMLPLLLEIPFFIAAYRFLSGYGGIRGVSFGPIADLGKPDALLTIASLSINILPVLMTLINIISGAIYTKGMPFKSRLQLYAMALVFLVFLYDSPAGLVFYWTLNNLFSLVKNIFYKLKPPVKLFKYGACGIGALLFVYVAFITKGSNYTHNILIGLTGCMMCLPAVCGIFKKKNTKTDIAALKEINALYICGAAFLFLLTGLLIPSAVIASSPVEFVSTVNPLNPVRYVLHALPVSLGTFGLWMSVFYALSGDEAKKGFAGGVFAAALIFTADYLFFEFDLETLAPSLVYEKGPDIKAAGQLTNLVILAVTAFAGILISRKRQFTRLIIISMALAVTGLGIKNLYVINSEYKVYLENAATGNTGEPEIPLSIEGKNVMVIMLDRAIDGYVPYIMNESPELKEKFDGFVWYPDVTSYGTSTNFGAPGLFGGYDYTPERIDKRDTELLRDKHDEALKVMPAVFGDAGYEVTVIDPPYAGYSFVPDLSIYDGMENVKAYDAGRSAITKETDEKLEYIKEHSFFRFALTRVMPYTLRLLMYDSGAYFDEKASEPDYSEAYYILDKLPSYVKLTDDKGTFLMMDNDTAHDNMLLKKPEYKPAKNINNDAYHAEHELMDDKGNVLEFETPYQEGHYDVNMLAYMELSKLFDRMRELNVYDNTRIILVSDHGRQLEHIKGMVLDNGLDIEWFNALLMVKDFDAHGFCTDETFMTNADVPAIAMEGMIEDPVNPYTGNAIDMSRKEGVQKVVFSESWDVLKNNGYVFDIGEGGQWYEIEDSIFSEKSWVPVEAP